LQKAKKKATIFPMQIENNLPTEQGLQVSKQVIARRNQDGTVIIMRMDDSSFFYKIDGIAAQVWTALVSRKTVTELNEHFVSQYPEFRNQLQQDIPAFVAELKQKNLLIEC